MDTIQEQTQFRNEHNLETIVQKQTQFRNRHNLETDIIKKQTQSRKMDTHFI